ncbi:hypothetical protein [Clostridium sp. OS1-26]|uniref:hypothetical protein n=1 Tax=Clostridium sp. OS1-26 TaxID=3070681 RepID=UPI0027E016FF|nr:hypothetical protein [Clostridium sp. OS1-26]WML33526.1 hypothetical protein RCG18_19570 [Clostridium sp. OS1-26]
MSITDRFEYISNWAEKFDLYDELLNSIFASLWNDKIYKPLIEPEGFQRNLPVLKSAVIGDLSWFSSHLKIFYTHDEFYPPTGLYHPSYLMTKQYYIDKRV